MENWRSSFALFAILVVLLLVCAGLTWANYRLVLQSQTDLQMPLGINFLSRWMGTRQFLLEGQSPYSEETTQASQRLAYGRLAGEQDDPLFFLYPFYSFLLFSPFAVMEDFVLARALWMTLLEVALFLTAWVSLSLSRWRPSIFFLPVLFVFTAFWYHSLSPIAAGDAAVVSTLLIVMALACIRAEQDVLAGLLLVLATIKPQMVLVLAVFILAWAISWDRWTLVWSFLGSLALTVGATSILLPSWLWENFRQVLFYVLNFHTGTPGAIFTQALPGVGRQMGLVMTIFAAGILFWEWRAAMHKEFRWFLWTAYLSLVLTNLIGMRTSPEHYIAMYPALLLVLATWDQRWGRIGQGMTAITLVLLFFGSWGLAWGDLSQGIFPAHSRVLFFGMPFFMLFGLYWVRWWATRPPRLLLELDHRD